MVKTSSSMLFHVTTKRSSFTSTHILHSPIKFSLSFHLYLLSTTKSPSVSAHIAGREPPEIQDLVYTAYVVPRCVWSLHHARHMANAFII